MRRRWSSDAPLRALCSCALLLLLGSVGLHAQDAKQADAARDKVASASGNSASAPDVVHPQPVAAVIPPPATFDLPGRSRAILTHLNAVVRFFRLATAPIQKIGEPSDALYRDQALSQATQVADLAFQSSRAEAALIAAFERQTGARSEAHPEGEAQRLQTVRATTAQKLADLKAQLQTINQTLAHAKPKQRPALEQQAEIIDGEIDLYTAMGESLRKIGASTDAGANGTLTGDIDRLQRSIPELAASRNRAVPALTLESLSAARSAGVTTQAAVLFQLLSTRHALTAWIGELDDLHTHADGMRTPLVALVRGVLRSGQMLSQQSEEQSSDASSRQIVQPADDVHALRCKYETFTATFNAVSAAIVPLSQELVTLEQSRANLLAWRGVVDDEYQEILRRLLFKVLAIALALGVLSILSSLWQRASIRYIQDVRRRRQLLVIRRVVVSFLGGLIVIFGFVTQFNSLATFAGFITAGIAVGLQTILLSVAAYFFIVGRFGVRVGDRITVAGVTGDVIDVGLVRFYLMELAGSGTELKPTGRVAVFANSVLFQAGTPLYRQMPGAEYGWHELSVKLATSSNYNKAETMLTRLVEHIFAKYQASIAQQHRQVESWMDTAIPAPSVDSRLQLVEGGLQLYIRYPVTLPQASATDQELTEGVVALMEHDEEIKAAVIAPPIIRALVKG